MQCDFLREKNARLTRKAAEVLKLRSENERLRARLNGIRAEEFWDRNTGKEEEMMPVGGSRPLQEILAGLLESVHRGARLRKEPLVLETLRKKMVVRTEYGNYSEEAPHSTLVRKAG